MASMRMLVPASMAALMAGCCFTDPVVIQEMKVDGIRGGLLHFRAAVDTSFELEKYRGVPVYFQYVIVDESLPDRREDWRRLDGASGGDFIVFYGGPEASPPTNAEGGEVRLCDAGEGGPFHYRISIPLAARTRSSRPEPEPRIEETYQLERAKTYRLWGRLQGWKYLFDTGLRSQIYSLTFTVPP